MAGVVVALLLQTEPTVSNGWTIVVVGEAKMTTVSKMRFVVGQGRTLELTLRRRERQNGPKWQYYLGQTDRHRSPLPTTIYYIEYNII